MLVIMEYRNIHGLLKTVFNIKALRSLDVLQVDTAEAWLQHFYSATDVIYILGIQAQRDSINTGKCLEENSFSFHYWQTSTSTDVAKAKDCSAVSDNSYHVGLGCIIINFAIIIFNFETWSCYSWGIGQSQVLRGVKVDLADNLKLALVFLMKI